MKSKYLEIVQRVTVDTTAVRNVIANLQIYGIKFQAHAPLFIRGTGQAKLPINTATMGTGVHGVNTSVVTV